MRNHISVLNNEVIDLLDINPNGTYADFTLGAGGHSLRILENLDSNGGKLFCFDVDTFAIQNFRSLIKDDKRVVLVNDNFVRFDEYVDCLLDGMLLDLGWSSNQLETVEGLSFKRENDRLDMRLDSSLGVNAADLLNALGRKELKKMLSDYADIRGKNANILVNAILKYRKKKHFEKVSDLKNVISSQFPVGDLVNLYTRVFQALRISVNQELSILKKVLPKMLEHLKTKGKLLIITFHSGEEKVVKTFIQSAIATGNCESITESSHGLYIRPTVSEIQNNFRSRSAKLFGIQKLK
jgi:16S rRNA (cytosine1402-N4)-methyltransferase